MVAAKDYREMPALDEPGGAARKAFRDGGYGGERRAAGGCPQGCTPRGVNAELLQTGNQPSAAQRVRSFGAARVRRAGTAGDTDDPWRRKQSRAWRLVLVDLSIPSLQKI